MWSILNFGKHKDKSLPEVILHDPDWFFWAEKNHVLDRGILIEEATLLDYRARNIRIPRANPEDWCVQYIARDGKFADFQIVEVSTPWDSWEAWRGDRLDLSLPTQLTRYDKLGCRLLLKRFKHYFFGNQQIRLTKKRCEGFFENQDNFMLGRKLLPPRSLEPSDENEGKSSFEFLFEGGT